MIFPPDNRKHVISLWHSVLATNVVGAGRIIMPDGYSCHTGALPKSTLGSRGHKGKRVRSEGHSAAIRYCIHWEISSQRTCSTSRILAVHCAVFQQVWQQVWQLNAELGPTGLRYQGEAQPAENF